MSLLSGYVLALVYRALFISGRKRVRANGQTWPQHLFSLIAGTGLSWFNYGADTLHFFVIITVSWLILKLGGPRSVTTGVLFLWTFGYLLGSYVFYETENYDINWTTSYCVMCLRLIGFGFDFQDGRRKAAGAQVSSSSDSSPVISEKPVKLKKMDILKSNWDNVELSELPSLLELFGYCFFFCGFMVGPQFPFMLYRRFVTLEVFRFQEDESENDKDNKDNIYIPSSAAYALQCFTLGVIYMGLTQLGKIYVPSSFVATSLFAELPFLHKIVYVALAGKVVLIKYLGIWLVNEVSCVLVGLSYIAPAKGKIGGKWNGLSNVDPRIYETVSSLGQIVASFNMNTNMWCKNYVFKRLKFLGSKELSGLGTLIFLAIWHGWHPAYFAVFFTEFIDMEAERGLQKWFAPLWNWIYSGNTLIKILLQIFGRVFCYLLTNIMLSYATVAFEVLRWENVLKFWSSMYWYAHLCVVAVLVIDVLFQKRTPKHPHRGHEHHIKHDHGKGIELAKKLH